VRGEAAGIEVSLIFLSIITRDRERETEERRKEA
jgi:hypothetical protein